MKKLERKWSRVCFVLLMTAAACVAAPWLLLALLKVESEVFPIVFGLLAALCALLEVILSRKFLCCPNCGKSTVPPRWNNKVRFRCTRCAAIFPFDDQPEIVYESDDEDDEDWDDEEEEEWDDEEEWEDEDEQDDGEEE